MKTVHNSQSIRKKDELSAANDDNLTITSVYLLSLINRHIALHGEFNLTGQEISEKWSKITRPTANRSIKELEDNGYIKIVESGDLFDRSRIIETLEESDKVKVKPHVKEKSLEVRKKTEMFEVFWNKYNVKKGKKKAQDKFLKLSMADCKKCLDAVGSYVIATPDVKYRKHVITWLNGEHWNDKLTVSSVVGAYNNKTKEEEKAKYNQEMKDYILMQREKTQRLKDRFDKFGWQKPFPNYKDILEKNRIEANGFEADIEEITTKRLKREGKQYKK